MLPRRFGLTGRASAHPAVFQAAPTFPQISFELPLADLGDGEVDITLARGVGTGTFTRATAAWTRNSAGEWIEVAAGTPRSYYSAAGVYMGYLAEGARTNHFLNASTPANQTSPSLDTGTYALWMEGSGSVTVSANTATITGDGEATAGNPVIFTVTVAGTVDYTVSGSPDFVVSELGAFPGTFIDTAASAVTRNADVLTYTNTGNVDGTRGWVYAEVSTLYSTSANTSVAIGATSDNFLLYISASLIADRIRQFDGTNLSVAGAGTTNFNGSVRKVAGAWGGSTMIATKDGTLGSAALFDGNFSPNGIGIGCDTGGGDPWFGTLRNVRIGVVKANDLALQVMTR